MLMRSAIYFNIFINKELSNMPRKCCVPCCNSGYASSTTKVSTYRFPSDEYEKDKWIKAIPRKNLVVNKYTVVCRFHWPVDCKSFT